VRRSTFVSHTRVAAHSTARVFSTYLANESCRRVLFPQPRAIVDFLWSRAWLLHRRCSMVARWEAAVVMRHSAADAIRVCCALIFDRLRAQPVLVAHPDYVPAEPPRHDAHVGQLAAFDDRAVQRSPR